MVSQQDADTVRSIFFQFNTPTENSDKKLLNILVLFKKRSNQANFPEPLTVSL